MSKSGETLVWGVIKFGENNFQECVKRIFFLKLYWAQMLHQFAKNKIK
jgi:hypothetical protein